MVNKFREDLRRNVKRYFINHETWNTPCFKFTDDDLTKTIFCNVNLANKGIIYRTVKYISDKAEFGIEDRVRRVGEDYYLAKDYMKFKKILPLLIKIRGYGWKEPTYEELDDDQKRRFLQKQKGMRFSEKRSQRIKHMKDIDVSIMVKNEKEKRGKNDSGY